MIINWIHCYLSLRFQQTIVNGQQSSLLPVLSGVPQGSILGPLLFTIYLNGVCDVPLNSTISLFADDMVLYRVVDSLTQLQYLQDDVDLVSNWISSHYCV